MPFVFFVLLLVLPRPSFAGSPWSFQSTGACFRFVAAHPSLKDKKAYLDLLAGTADWLELSGKLQAATSAHLKQPFQMRVTGATGQVPPPLRTEAYDGAKFVVGKSPADLPPGATLVPHFDFGYHVGSDYRRLGSVNYAIVGADGKVLEVGGGTPEVISEFKAHLLGRTLSSDELKTISDINKSLIGDLKADPVFKAKVAEFATERGWPEGLAEQGGLAYFSRSDFPLQKWAKEHGYTEAQMRDAGWMKLTFDYDGRPSYFVNSQNSIKIPFFTGKDHEDMPLWRSRQLGNKDPEAPKYIGWQLDRSLDRTLTPAERLYNGGSLSRAKGKTIVITEGEFKTLVAENASGKITVGLPGITEWDHALVKGLVESGAKEFIVVLDRDAEAKGLARVDGVSDSERAAYALGKALEAAGAPSVKVGLLPDTFGGGKVGIDDLILAKGTRPYNKVLKDAVSPDDYGKQVELDPIFQALLYRRQQLRKSIDAYERSKARGGPVAEAETVTTAKQNLWELDQAFKNYLHDHYNEARFVDQAAAKESSLSRVSAIPDEANKTITVHGGQELSPKAFTDEILVFDYTPSDLKDSVCKPVPCKRMPYTSAQLRQAFQGKAKLGALKADVAKGTELAKQVGLEAKTLEDFAAVSLSGQLAKSFPPEEYYFEYNVSLSHRSGPVGQVPLVIRRIKGGKVVAIAQMRLPAGEKLAEDNAAFLRAGKRLETIVDFFRADAK